MKRVLSLVLALTLVLGSIPAGFAATETAGETLKGYGLLTGDSAGNLNEDKSIDRASMITVLIRLLGQDAAAKAYTVPSTFTDDDTNWAKNYIAYAEKEALTSGVGNGLFAPAGKVTLQQMAKFMMTALGYEVTDYATVVEQAQAKGLLTNVVATDKDAVVLKADVYTSMLNTVNAPLKDSTQKLGEKLGVLTATPVVTAVDVKSAVALNSKVVEVTLNTAATAVKAADFAVKDAAGAALVVTAASLAAYDADNTTVLLTLEKDTTVGTLYTLTAGTTSVNFGGRAADTTKPSLITAGIASTGYNEMTVTFDEAVQLDGAKVTVAAKYGTKAALATTTIAYGDDNTQLVISTADQSASTLYGVTVEGVKDMAGNVMDKDDAQTFVGKAKPTATLKVTSAYAYNPEEIVVVLTEKPDTATLVGTNFTVEEAYGAKTKVTVTAARIATTDDYVDAAKSAANDSNEAKVRVVLTVPSIKDNTLYKITAAGLKDYVGNALSSTASETYTTCVSIAKPTTTFMYATTAVTVKSATSIEVNFGRKVDETLAETVANYTIAQTNVAKTPLAVTSAVLKSNGTAVTLTVAEMTGVLYKLTTANIKDIYGNSQKTGTDAETTFVGAAKQAAITEISSITRLTDTTIRVAFDAKVGANATDVSLYTINNSVGYPVKAVKATSSTGSSTTAYVNEVILTIPKTTEGTNYVLTVKGLNNADGIAMTATAGITGNFAGQGVATGLPVVQAVVADSKKSVKIYFDRSVSDTSVKALYTSATAPFFQLKQNKTGAVLATPLTIVGTYKDSVDANVLHVVFSDEAMVTGTGYTTYIFDLVPTTYDGVKVKFDTNVTQLEVAASSTAYAAPKVDAVQGIDAHTVKVYFDKPVQLVNGMVAIKIKSSNVGLTEGTAVAVTGTSNKEWLIPITETMTAVSHTATFTTGTIADKYDVLTKLDDEDTSATNAALVKEFAGNATTTNYIVDIYAMMKDNRTIEVIFPEAMNYDSTAVNNTNKAPIAGQVDFAADYTILTAAGGVLAGAPTVNHVMYDKTTNVATLYLSGDLPAATTTFGLQIDTAMANLTGNKTVEKSSTSTTTDLLVEVAKNTTTTNKGPAIDSVSVAGDRMSITVTMTENVGFGTVGALAADFTDANSDDEYVLAANEVGNKFTNADYTLVTKADMLDALKVTTTLVGGTEAALADADLASVVVNGTDITFNLVKAVKPGAAGIVTTKVGTTVAAHQLFNTALIARSQTENESKANFAAPVSATFDYTGAKVSAATFRDEFVGSPLAASPVAGHDGILDTIVVVFNEDIQSIAKTDLTLTIGTNYATNETGKDFAVAVSGDTMTVVFTATNMLKVTGQSAANDITLAIADGKLLDANSNELLADDGTALAGAYTLTTLSTENAGNVNKFEIADAAAPVITTAVLGNEGAGVAANFQNNDILEVSFSETVSSQAATFAGEATPLFAELNALFTFSGGALTDMTFDTTDDITGGATSWSLQAASDESANVITTAHTITPKVANTVQIKDAAGNYLAAVATDIN